MGAITEKMQRIKSVVRAKKAWLDAFNFHPYEAWRRRGDYLCRQLVELSDMQRNYNQKKQKETRQ